FATSLSLAPGLPGWPSGPLAVGDLDGDGVDDVTTLRSLGFSFAFEFISFLGDGVGGFSGPITGPTVSAGAAPFELFDYDGDGVLDAVVAWRVGTVGGVYAHPGLGNGSFGAPASVVGKTWFEGFTIADLGAGAGNAV